MTGTIQKINTAINEINKNLLLTDESARLFNNQHLRSGLKGLLKQKNLFAR